MALSYKLINDKMKTINSKKEVIQLIIMVVICIIFIYMWVTVAIQAIKCPEMTTTQLLLNIPNSFLLNFK